VGLGGGWAAKSLLTPSAALPTAAGYVVATATKDTIARSLRLDAKATWAGGTQVAGGLAGTVTSVHLKGAVTASQSSPRSLRLGLWVLPFLQRSRHDGIPSGS
jgi:hypothetical protein